jgi:regulator of protease activity HflC (stomatin/prohibitin superfamily)
MAFDWVLITGVGLVLAFCVALLYFSIVIVRPTHRGLIERLGKYNRFAGSGFNIIIPLLERVYKVNITEQMVTATPQEIITKDKLNAMVDAQIYFKVKNDEESVKASQYNVFDYHTQIVALARTTLRNIIGTMMLMDANSQRDIINRDLMSTLSKETTNWGIEVVRTELKEINPPTDVQNTMNSVVMAENKKTAALDLATAAETEADGFRRAAIKKADGEKQATILKAEGDAMAIQLVNTAANQYFVDNAQTLRKLEAVETALKSNAKIVIPVGESLVNVISEAAGITPMPITKDLNKEQTKRKPADY